MRKIVACCLGLIATVMIAEGQIRADYLRTEYQVNPFVEEAAPRLSWELRGEGYNQSQSAYRILVASSSELLASDTGDLWDSGEQQSERTNQIEYAGKALASGQRAYWKIRTRDQNGQWGVWSETSYWELGKVAATDWQGKWIGADLNSLAKPGAYILPPSPYIRKEIDLNKKIKKARLYVSSLGLHNFYINGDRVGDDYFGSGWTDYNKRVYYQVYDVTAKIKEGDNVFGAILSDGWYSGYLGYAMLVGSPQVRQFYGQFPLLKAQIDIEFEDGTQERIATDRTWKTSTGAVTESDFLQGETHNAMLEPEDWNKVGFDDSNWGSIQEFPDQEGRALQLYPGNPVRVVDEIPIKSIEKRPDGKYIVDFGQNFAGNIRLKMKGNRGDSVVFRFGEMLFPDGRLMTDNLRKARSVDTYIFAGDEEEEIWSPSFTFHGFQFVEISGLKEEPSADFLTGLVLSSDLEDVGDFEVDNPMLNQLYSNIVWTQRANYIDIPTDCPQRDERLGWTGDAQIYMRSAIFNSDVAPFHKKWIRDLQDSQWPNGAYPVYAPMPVNDQGVAAIRADDSFSPGWSDAGIICTYEYFKAYDDHRIVEESLPYMLKYMAFLKDRTTNHVIPEGAFEDVTPKGGFGDWLSVGKKTSPDLLATMYYFYCSNLMAEMCEVVGQTDQAAEFRTEMKAIQNGFGQHYMDASGRLKIDPAVYGDGAGYVDGQEGFSGHTQTAYANAIYSGILNQDEEIKAGNYLRELIEQNGNKISTGFLGFKPLLPALTKTGSSDYAYMLLQSTEYPSLGYEVVNGATSIWERWDSYTKEEGFVHNAAMNSFSHYAFGSVNEWMFERILGIQLHANGFREIRIRPEIGDYGINRAAGSYHSISGLIESAWERQDDRLNQRIAIPVNTTAHCYVKTESLANILVNGKPVDQLDYIRDSRKEGEYVILTLGSGKYELETKL
ncbi:MAG: family 78 glycoside hydrolase catalytic domain [Sphingobacterium sp.]